MPCAKCWEKQPDVFSITKTVSPGGSLGPKALWAETLHRQPMGLASREPTGLLKLQAALVTFARSWGSGVCGWSKGKV